MVRVTVLGSGDAFGSGGRLHSAYLVEAPSCTFLLECGPSALQGLKRARIDTGRLDFVLLSHLHGDHFGGIPFLLLEYRYENPRTRPIEILGPPQTERRCGKLYEALYERIAHEDPPYPVRYRELAPATPLTIQGVSIAPFVVPHAAELTCFGYRIGVGGRTILFSGDTAWTEELVTASQGVDLFLLECTTYETRLDLHLSYPEIARRAGDFGCRRLLLTHLGSEPLAHAGELTIECAQDGQVIEL
jgi:ribonuclease BN (tRNA processing enzyme)